MTLNERAAALVEHLISRPEDSRIAVHPVEGGGRYVDRGIECRGGLLTGVRLARIGLAGLASVQIEPGILERSFVL
jgi:methenyltetrahydromethanopterin cyclohydrolase